ncbi:hypothetical protein JOD55_001464 [Arcanobacterium pluranimalium]|uniref:hypothetical protein n=1 Tax=Arcanobacterium pluranimalium TaxID=108028 RepID=UPI00195A1360|nr:hypothetical protein [Arcanobacterium pluranimalium]MBM7825637.1 hypothetical protein [Arcanobacterium pluranimalium]
MDNTQEVKHGCGCGGHGHAQNAVQKEQSAQEAHGGAHGHGGHGHGGHGGCGGGRCGCGGKGKRAGMHTEATPANAPADISGGRTQLGLRGK